MSAEVADELKRACRGTQPSCCGWQAGMGRVRPDGVVVLAPPVEQPPGLAEAGDDLLVQQLVPQPADEALGEGVLLRLAPAPALCRCSLRDRIDGLLAIDGAI